MPVETMALPKRCGETLVIIRNQGLIGLGNNTNGSSCGPNAVEHVRSEGDGDEEIFGVADAHYVARFILREPIRAGVHADIMKIRNVFLKVVTFDRTYT